LDWRQQCEYGDGQINVSVINHDKMIEDTAAVANLLESSYLGDSSGRWDDNELDTKTFQQQLSEESIEQKSRDTTKYIVIDATRMIRAEKLSRQICTRC